MCTLSIMLFRQSYIDALQKQLAKAPDNLFVLEAKQALEAINAIPLADLRGVRKPLAAQTLRDNAEQLRRSLFGLATEQTLTDLKQPPSEASNVIAMPNRTATLFAQGKLDTVTNEKTNPWNGLLAELGKQMEEINTSYKLGGQVNQR